jgi:uncharacterized membrane protein YdjX (TVP38/TMEM64 family)
LGKRLSWPVQKISALALLAVVGATGWLLVSGASEWLPFIQHCQDSFATQYEESPRTLLCGFFCLFTLTAALALPGAALLMLVAGASFGLLGGTLLALLASTAGATLNMLVARHFLRARVERQFGPKLAEINAGIAREGAFYLFSLRMAPIIPFIVLNPLLGLTRMKTWTFFWVSALGMLAGTAAYVNAGRQLAQIDTPAAIISPGLITAFALLGVLPLLSNKVLQIYRRRLRVDAPKETQI